jgi:hypothetical protein
MQDIITDSIESIHSSTVFRLIIRGSEIEKLSSFNTRARIALKSRIIADKYGASIPEQLDKRQCQILA